MNELTPREIIEVAVLAGDDETGWNDSWRLARLRAVAVNVTNLVGAVRRFQRKQSTAERSQPPTVRADHPAGKRGHRDADQRRGVELVDLISVRHHRRRPQRKSNMHATIPPP